MPTMNENSRAYRHHLFNRLVDCGVPDHLHEGLIEYFASHRPVGHFLTAVLSNDFLDACLRADPWTQFHLQGLAQFLVNYTPDTARGSPEKVNAWLKADEPVPEIYE